MVVYGRGGLQCRRAQFWRRLKLVLRLPAGPFGRLAPPRPTRRTGIFPLRRVVLCWVVLGCVSPCLVPGLFPTCRVVLGRMILDRVILRFDGGRRAPTIGRRRRGLTTPIADRGRRRLFPVPPEIRFCLGPRSPTFFATRRRRVQKPIQVSENENPRLVSKMDNSICGDIENNCTKPRATFISSDYVLERGILGPEFQFKQAHTASNRPTDFERIQYDSRDFSPSGLRDGSVLTVARITVIIYHVEKFSHQANIKARDMPIVKVNRFDKR